MLFLNEPQLRVLPHVPSPLPWNGLPTALRRSQGSHCNGVTYCSTIPTAIGRSFLSSLQFYVISDFSVSLSLDTCYRHNEFLVELHLANNCTKYGKMELVVDSLDHHRSFFLHSGLHLPTIIGKHKLLFSYSCSKLINVNKSCWGLSVSRCLTRIYVSFICSGLYQLWVL